MWDTSYMSYDDGAPNFHMEYSSPKQTFDKTE